MHDPARKYVKGVIGILFVVLTAINVQADESDGGAEAANQAQGQSGEMIRLPVYRPPILGAPQFRVGGGTRSITQLYVLAPQHVGLTASSRPRLYWFVSTGDRGRIKFFLTDKSSDKLLLELAWDVPAMKGITYLDLSDHGIHLKEGITYRWAIFITPDKGIGPETITSQGFVQHIRYPQLKDTEPVDLPFVAARAGLWYDAFSAISKLIERNPAQLDYRYQRAALLDQVGLKSAARFDKSN